MSKKSAKKERQRGRGRNDFNQGRSQKKWCPMARVQSETGRGVPINRQIMGRPDSGSFCLADDCMMWNQRHVDGVERGYCGLCR